MNQQYYKKKPFIISMVSAVIAVLGLFAYTPLLQYNNSFIEMIKNAPENPTQESSFAFFSGRPDVELLEDSVLPVTCQGHFLFRSVEQYVYLPTQDTHMWIDIPDIYIDYPSQFPIKSKVFFPKSIKIGTIQVLTESWPVRHYLEEDQATLTLSKELPPHVTQLDERTFFIGNDVENPQEGSIFMHYECGALPTLSAWGARDDQFFLSPSPLGENVSEDSLVDSRDRLLTHHLGFMNFLHCFYQVVAALLILSLMKSFYQEGVGRTLLPAVFKRARQLAPLLGIAVALAPLTVTLSNIVILGLVFYFGCRHIVRNH